MTTPVRTASPKLSLAECACFNARNAARAVTDFYDAALAPAGLRINQFATLAAIEHRESGSMQTIAADLGLDPSTMTRVLRPLVDDELVCISPGENRREKQLSLTERGRKKLLDTHPLWETAQESLREAVGADVFERLVGDLAALRNALRV